MNLLMMLMQQDSTAAVDTLTSSYANKWEGADKVEHANSFIGMMASHHLIFIVLAVSLIIWFILLFFIIQTDKKVSKLEEMIGQESTEDHS